jgi:hypothetical protein
MYKEQLLLNKNGQWKLIKTNPTNPESYQSVYGLNLNDPNGRYTGDDLLRMQNKAIENNPNYTRNMVNIETGNEEPHLLVHFGNDRYDPNFVSHTNRNGMRLNDKNNVHVYTTNGAVVSTHANYSSGFAAPGGDIKPQSRLFSFWVPKSKIHADSGHELAGATGYDRLSPEEKAKYWSESPRHIDHLNIMGKTPEMPLSEYYGRSYGHTHIMPGEYQPANFEDIRIPTHEGPEKAPVLIPKFRIDKDLAEIKRLHQHTFPHLYAPSKNKND